MAQVSVQKLLTPGATIPLLFKEEDAGMLRVLEAEIIPSKGSAPQPEVAMTRSGPLPMVFPSERANHSMEAESGSYLADVKGGNKFLGPVIWDHEIINAESARIVQVLCLGRRETLVYKSFEGFIAMSQDRSQLGS